MNVKLINDRRRARRQNIVRKRNRQTRLTRPETSRLHTHGKQQASINNKIIVQTYGWVFANVWRAKAKLA